MNVHATQWPGHGRWAHKGTNTVLKSCYVDTFLIIALRFYLIIRYPTYEFRSFLTGAVPHSNT